MLQSRLLGIVQRELESQDLQVSAYCTQRIEEMVANGVTRMRIQNTEDHAGYIMRAEQNLMSLIKYFCDYAQDQGTFPTLSNSDFDSAMVTCPTIWPFSTSG